MKNSQGLELPLLDASLFLSDDLLKRREFADQFSDSLSKHGFAIIINHGIPDSLVEEVFARVCPLQPIIMT
jgi:isopenicillin N synthase-like dioxygenase